MDTELRLRVRFEGQADVKRTSLITIDLIVHSAGPREGFVGLNRLMEETSGQGFMSKCGGGRERIGV